jgi:hypothetical protein
VRARGTQTTLGNQLVEQEVGEDVVSRGEGCATLGAAPVQLHRLGDARVAERVPAPRHVRLLDQLEAHRTEQVAVLRATRVHSTGSERDGCFKLYRSKAHLQEIVRCSFKLKLDLDVIPSFSN